MIVVHDGPMDLDWDRLGKALQAARRALDGKPTQEQVATELGLSRTLIQNIERGKGFEKPTPSIREYARRLGWADGSVDRVLAGGEPVLASEAGAQSSAPDLPGLPDRVQYELKQAGDLVDTAVIQLPGGGSAVVVVKNPADATPEQREKNLQAWLRMQGELQTLDYSDTGSSQGESNDA